MILYHGSNKVVKYPGVRKTKYSQDFYFGFYSLTDEDLAIRWAARYGEKGYLAITNINNPEKIERFDKDHNLIENYPIPQQVTGYEYQVIECLDAIKQGKISCPSMSHQETIEIMHIMDKLRKTWGIIYPQEKED